ncbi:MAG: hypothetical protein GY953_34285, partial [bacterium]|nr:hypothetical protein [bacterium]
MPNRNPAALPALLLVLFSVPALALTRISPTAVLAGGPAITLSGFADNEPFYTPIENTLTWRRVGETQTIQLKTTIVSNRELRAEVPAELIAEPGEVAVGVAGDPGTFPFTILAASEKPFARDDYVTAYRDIEIQIGVLAND